jgi:hypothetical protein
MDVSKEFFYLEDKDATFLRNVSTRLLNYAESHFRPKVIDKNYFCALDGTIYQYFTYYITYLELLWSYLGFRLC